MFVALRDFLQSREEAGIDDRAAVDGGDTLVLCPFQVLGLQLTWINEIPDCFKLGAGQNQTSPIGSVGWPEPSNETRIWLWLWSFLRMFRLL